MDQADRPSRQDRQSGGAQRAVEVRDQGPARLHRARGRLKTPVFGFVQWEFAGRLGPEPGRYVVRRFAGDDAQHVLVIGGLAAPRRQPRGARRRRVGAPCAVEVDVTRATVVDATPLADPDAWLETALADDGGAVEAEALAVLARAVAARRVAAADPWLPDPDPARALVTRLGYGPGEAVAEGEWTEACELERARPRGGRRRALEPQERVAALLSGRDAALACEELTLRARADLDRGRGREAALQLDAALRAALAELESWREHRDMAERLAELDGRALDVRAAADAALRGGLDEAHLSTLTAVLPRLEAALRARAA